MKPRKLERLSLVYLKAIAPTTALPEEGHLAFLEAAFLVAFAGAAFFAFFRNAGGTAPFLAGIAFFDAATSVPFAL